MKRRTFTALACVLALGMGATSAQALSITVEFYLGNIIPGLPAGETNEAAFITVLIGLAPSTSQTPCAQGASDPNLCTRSANTFGGATLPSPAEFGTKEDPTDGTVNVTGFSYLLAKYGKGGKDDNQISHVCVSGT